MRYHSLFLCFQSLNSKQRQLKKSGNQLTDADALELQRIATEQGVLQKHLEASRKQSRQHGMLIQVSISIDTVLGTCVANSSTLKPFLAGSDFNFVINNFCGQK